MGDGSFQICIREKKYLGYRVEILLKNTPSNLKMLQDQRDYYNYGTLRTCRGGGAVTWAINDRKQVHELLSLFVKNPLLDYKCSAKTKVLKMLYGIENSISYAQYSLWEKDISKWPFEKPLVSTTPAEFNENYKWWLCGFIEAEGCFSIRKDGRQSFSASQKNGELIMESIKTFFEIKNKIVRHKRSDVLEIEVGNRRCCFKVADFFEKYPLKGQKKVSFDLYKQHIESKYN